MVQDRYAMVFITWFGNFRMNFHFWLHEFTPNCFFGSGML